MHRVAAEEANSSAPGQVAPEVGGPCTPTSPGHCVAWSVCRRLCDPEYSGESLLSCQMT
jgi:hypothetical protein